VLVWAAHEALAVWRSPPDGLEPLGAHTKAYYATGYPYSNSAIVGGKDAVLVFDANIFHYAAELKAALDRVRAGRPVHLVLSRSHADDADGTMFFSPSAKTLASDFTRRRLAWWVGQDQTSRNAEYVDHYPAATTWYRAGSRAPTRRTCRNSSVNPSIS